MKITILITTYRRNYSLNFILNQLAVFYQSYSGTNSYKFLICNSDKNYPLDLSNSFLPTVVIENKNKGFDYNLLAGIRAVENECDYVFLMGDDDLFLKNPFEAIDSAFGFFKKDCYLFNHVNKNNLRRQKRPGRFSVPRYCGFLYRTKFLKQLSLDDFDGTLHLYAAPLLLTSKIKFIKKPLVVFNDSWKGDGAWQSCEAILEGLRKFLKSFKEILPQEKTKKLSANFFKSYFSEDSEVFHNKGRGLSYFKSADEV